MNKFTKILFTSLFFYLIGFLTASPVQAKVISSEKTVIIEANQVIDDDLFIGAESVRIEGTVNGDVYIGAGELEVSGTINGDLFAGAGTIFITGQIRDDVRVGGGDISFREATIGDSLTIGGGNVRLDDQTTIGGGLLFGAGNFRTDAKVGRGIIGGAGRAEVNAPVGKEVRLGVGELIIGNQANINGDLWYSSENDANISNEASISGTIYRQEYPKSDHQINQQQVRQSSASAGFGFQLWSFLSAVLVGLVLIWAFPDWLPKLSEQMTEKLSNNILFGFLYIILVIPLFIMLLITIIGIPIAIIWIIVFVLALYLSKLIAGYWMGEWIKTKFKWKTENRYSILIAGLFVWYILRTLPLVGWIVGLVTVVIVLGTMTKYCKDLIYKRK